MGTPLRVLFIEDSEGDARLIALRLQDSGYDVLSERVATAEALSAALAKQPWDIVIADYLVPSFGGLEALAMVQESGLELPVIIASGVIGEDMAVEAMRSGAYDYVMKDNLARLGAAVQRALQEADVRRARKQAEEELKRSEEHYKLAQRAASIGSWDWDILTGKLHWSDQIEPMFGLAPGEFKATYEEFLECVHPDDRQYVIDSVNACVLEGHEYSIEHRIVWPDGSIHWVAEIGDVIRDRGGEAIRMLGIVRDITERKQAEEEIKNLARFPAENPYPVLRVAKDGTIVYANTASSSLLEVWQCRVGQPLPVS